MLVALLTTGASLAVSISLICIRRGSLRAHPNIAVVIAVGIGCIVFPFVSLSVGELGELPNVGWQAIALFALAGAVHFVIGRSMNYRAIQSLGASRTSAIVTTYPLFALPIAIPLFGETLTVLVAAGAVLVVAGPILIIQGERRASLRMISGGSSITPADLAKGTALALGAAFFLAMSFVLVKAALNLADVPVLGTTVSYWAAGLLVVAYVSERRTRSEMTSIDPSALRWFVAGGIFIALSQVMRYLALSQGDVTIVVVVMQSVPIFVFVLTFLVNRTIEVLNGYVIAGSILVVLGSSLVVTQA